MYLIERGLEWAFGYIYGAVYAFAGGHGAALMLMSVIVTLLTAPLTRYASSGQMKEKRIKDVLKPQIDKICSESSGAKRYARISALYRRYAYHPIYSLRTALALLTQILFLMAAYYFLSDYKALEGRHFLFIEDLSRPDMILWGANLLPIVMTLINMLSACIAPGFGRKETLRAWVIAFLFLALLYTSPAALLLFWTCNNLWGLLENLRLYYASEEKSPFAAMFANFFAILHSLPGSFAGSRFARFVPPTAFLVVMKAVVSAASAPLSRFGFPETMLAITLCEVMLLFQAVFVTRREKKRLLPPWLEALPWVSAIVLGLLFYGSFWKYFFADIDDVYETWQTLFILSDVFAYVGRGGARNARLIVMGFFICLIMILLFSRVGKKTDIGERQPPNRWDYAMTALSAVTPATFQALNNLDYLTVNTVWIYYAVLVSLAFVVYLLVSFVWRGRFSKRDTALIVSVFMFCLIINPSSQRYFARYGLSTLVFALVFLPSAALAVSRERNSRNITLLLLVSLIFPCVNFFRVSESINLTGQGSVFIEQSVKISDANRDSVFLLVYDAIPDLETLDALGADSAPLKKILRNYDFKVYPDTYSIGSHSILSMGLTYDIANDPIGHNFRDACAGNSKVFRIFSRNSYGTCIIQDNYMTGGRSFADESFPPMQRIDFEKESLLSLLRGILTGEFRFD
ncbi:MAG: YidC/Oxa1 family membrane protein insertase, partial [Synergistaceae bacterium]|nr:YidC/Oxa1 family membrane protein insertase [Synergistaceae bacterium]